MCPHKVYARYLHQVQDSVVGACFNRRRDIIAQSATLSTHGPASKFKMSKYLVFGSDSIAASFGSTMASEEISVLLILKTFQTPQLPAQELLFQVAENTCNNMRDPLHTNHQLHLDICRYQYPQLLQQHTFLFLIADQHLCPRNNVLTQRVSFGPHRKQARMQPCIWAVNLVNGLGTKLARMRPSLGLNTFISPHRRAAINNSGRGLKVSYCIHQSHSQTPVQLVPRSQYCIFQVVQFPVATVSIVRSNQRTKFCNLIGWYGLLLSLATRCCKNLEKHKRRLVNSDTREVAISAMWMT